MEMNMRWNKKIKRFCIIFQYFHKVPWGNGKVSVSPWSTTSAPVAFSDRVKLLRFHGSICLFALKSNASLLVNLSQLSYVLREAISFPTKRVSISSTLFHSRFPAELSGIEESHFIKGRLITVRGFWEVRLSVHIVIKKSSGPQIRHTQPYLE